VTASALSRQCDGWWGPDDLLEVERGAWSLDDAAIVSLCHLYGLPGRALPAPDAIELVDDGATSFRATCETGLVRLASICGLLGSTAWSTVAGLDVLSTVFEMSGDEVQNTMARLEGPSRDTVEDVRAALMDRVAVPAVGLLVSATPSGSLVLTRRAGAGRRANTDRMAAAGPLRWFTVVSAASA
jgi:hypothetical protein